MCPTNPGHVIVDGSEQSPCRCAGNGCLEAVASGWALMERARRRGVEATPREIFERARAGEARLSQLVDQAATSVGIGLATLCVLLNPDTVVLGGGVAHDAGERFRVQVEQTMRRHAVPFFREIFGWCYPRPGRRRGCWGRLRWCCLIEAANLAASHAINASLPTEPQIRRGLGPQVVFLRKT